VGGEKLRINRKNVLRLKDKPGALNMVTVNDYSKGTRFSS
jgi:hypothetical protein